MKRMLDLFCGRFGWSKAFAERGWECVGVDLVEPSEVPAGCKFIMANVRSIPPELSACVADYAERLLEMRAA